MSKSMVSKFVKSAQMSLSKNGPAIATGVGIAGMFTTVIFAVEATPKALSLISDEKKERKVDKLTKKETIQVAWKPYIPAAVTGIISTVCIVGASNASAKRNAVLATAYSLSESALTEYQNKVVEVVGEKKDQEIKDEIAKDHIKKDPVVNREVIITEKGKTLCYDMVGGRYFMSDIDTIKKAENYLNKRMMSEMYISLNEFYFELGLRFTDLGDELGWNMNDGFIDIDFSSILTEEGEPCLAISYRVGPQYDYAKLM